MLHARPTPSPEGPALPISVYQHRYWAKWAENPGGSSFNTSMVFEISGDLDRRAFQRACGFLTEKHDITHAVFSPDGTTQHYGGFSLDEFFSEGTLDEEADLDAELRRLLNQPFDLGTGPLVRIYLLDHGSTSYLVAVAHHIIADATTAKVAATDLATAYLTFCLDSGGPPLDKYSYATCIDRLHASRTPEKQAAAETFWREALAEMPPIVNFPQRDGAPSFDVSAESIYFTLDAPTSKALRGFARENRTTLFIVLFALYGVVLSRYADQEEVAVSYPVDLRPPGFKDVLGCFVNLSLLKVACGRTTTFRDLVGDLTRRRKAARRHQFFQLGKIINEQAGLDIEKSYFGVFFGETHLNTTPLDLGALRITPVPIPWSEEFDRDLRLLYDAEDADQIKLRKDFRRAKYDRDLILRLIEDFKDLAGRVAGDERPLHELGLREARPT